MMAKQKKPKQKKVMSAEAKKRKRARKKKAAAKFSGVGTSNLVPGAVRTVRKFGSSIAGRIASGCGLPYEMGCRVPTSDSLATSHMKSMDRFSVTAAAGSVYMWGEADIVIHFLGQPGRLGYIWRRLATTTLYNMTFSNEIATLYPGRDGKWILIPFDLYSDLGHVSACDWPLISSMTTSNNSMHGPNMGIGFDSGNAYVWCNVGDTLQVFVDVGSHTSTSPLGFQFELSQWCNSELANEKVSDFFVTVAVGANLGSTTVTIQLANGGPGYYRIRFHDLSGYSAGASVTGGFADVVHTCAATGWGQISMGDLDTTRNGDSNLGHKCRLNGASLLVTNTTPMISRGGSVLAVRQNSKQWYDFGKDDFMNITETYNGDAAHGVYTFRQFDTVMEEWVSAVQNIRSAYAVSFPGIMFDLKANVWDHVIQITTPGTNYNTYNVIFEGSLEFQTDSSRYSKAIAAGTITDLQMARRVLNEIPGWFYENPTHAQQIYGFIKKLGKSALKAAPTIAGHMASSYPAHAMLLRALGQALAGLAI